MQYYGLCECFTCFFCEMFCDGLLMVVQLFCSLVVCSLLRYSLMLRSSSHFLWSPIQPLPQEQEFLQKQQQELDSALKKIIQQHKLEIATIERDCLNHKQQLMRGQIFLTNRLQIYICKYLQAANITLKIGLDQ